MHFLECTNRQEQGISVDLPKEIISFVVSQLKHHGPSTRQLKIEKTLSCSMIRDSAILN
jgi:hypothetical protein